MMNRYITLFLLLLALLVWACDETPFHPKKEANPVGNQPPETYLFLLSDTLNVGVVDSVGIDTTASKQVMHWWGDDSDGLVIGYYVQWDYQDEPVWTTAEYDTFYVPIRSKFDRFTIRVWAVDNDSLMDPTPAEQTFPVFNTRPEIEFKNRSNPSAPGGQPNVTAYTFPTRTFMWDVIDADGVQTVTHIYYALDDTSTWETLPGGERSVFLTDLPAGEHRFFVKAADIAGAESRTVSFPDPEDDTTPNTWIVKETAGDVLLINSLPEKRQVLFEGR